MDISYLALEDLSQNGAMHKQGTYHFSMWHLQVGLYFDLDNNLNWGEQ